MYSKHRARKRFGQNFLHDPVIIERITEVIHPLKEDRIIEIGPGKGALTKRLLQKVDYLHVIEIDRDLASALPEVCSEDKSRLMIHQKDVLHVDFSLFGDENLRIVGNLPYNISTSFLFHLIQYADRIKDMIFMLQKEVVFRICAKSGNKQYGRLSVMLQYYWNVQHLFTIKPDAFHPVPKVDSAMVKFIPHKTPVLAVVDPASFSFIVREAFSQRRKTIRNTLKNFFSEHDFKKVNISSAMRAEDLSVTNFVILANYYEDKKKKLPVIF